MKMQKRKWREIVWMKMKMGGNGEEENKEEGEVKGSKRGINQLTLRRLGSLVSKSRQ